MDPRKTGIDIAVFGPLLFDTVYSKQKTSITHLYNWHPVRRLQYPTKIRPNQEPSSVAIILDLETAIIPTKLPMQNYKPSHLYSS